MRGRATSPMSVKWAYVIVTAAVAGCSTVEAIGETLNAGTNCGSCRAEIREILNGTRIAAAE